LGLWGVGVCGVWGVVGGGGGGGAYANVTILLPAQQQQGISTYWLICAIYLEPVLQKHIYTNLGDRLR